MFSWVRVRRSKSWTITCTVTLFVIFWGAFFFSLHNLSLRQCRELRNGPEPSWGFDEPWQNAHPDQWPSAFCRQSSRSSVLFACIPKWSSEKDPTISQDTIPGHLSLQLCAISLEAGTYCTFYCTIAKQKSQLLFQRPQPPRSHKSICCYLHLYLENNQKNHLFIWKNNDLFILQFHCNFYDWNFATIELLL